MGFCPAGACVDCLNASRHAANRSTTPKTILYVWTGSFIQPPTKASGTDSTANGQNTFHEKQPARAYRIVPTVATLLKTFRELGLSVIHTREGHRPDLSDCPPAKKRRGDSALRIGDPGPMGRILVLGEPGNDIIPQLRPEAGELAFISGMANS